MEELTMRGTAFEGVEFVVRTIAETVIANETYFGELDSVVGDGDFGYSLARGFEKVLEEVPTMDRATIGGFLKKVGVTIASRTGGTSGPLWGTAFMRAGGVAGDKAELSGTDVADMLRGAAEGIQQRGGASLGEKTLLDSLIPLIDRFEAELAGGDHDGAFSLAAERAVLSAAATSALEAKRGRASYAGERSIGSPDAGAVAIGVIASSVNAAWQQRRQGEENHA
jgi:dihydroxyacetone kinase phosphoprotein-dependent L subunit